MTLIKYNNRFPRFFDDFFGKEMDEWVANGGTKKSTPAVNVKETEDGFDVEVAAPGLSKEDFKVDIDNDVLTISSEKEEKHEDQDKEGKYTQREFSYQSFKRSFKLPENAIDADKVAAKYEQGVLHLSLPKREEVKPKPARQIEIA